MSDEKLQLALHAACDLLETMGVRSPKIREWRMLAGVRCYGDPTEHERCADCEPTRRCFYSFGAPCQKASEQVAAHQEVLRCGSCAPDLRCFNGGSRCEKDPSNIGPLPLPPPEEP